VELEGNARGHCWSVQTTEDVSRSLAAIKTTLYGSGGEETSAEMLTQLSQEMCSGHLLQQLIENLGKIDFEASSLLCSITRPYLYLLNIYQQSAVIFVCLYH